MFDEIYATMRAYVIRKLAERVIADVGQNGLTPEDEAILDALFAGAETGDA